MNKVLTLGTFDLPHPGHIALLQGCRQLAGPNGTVTVGLNTDEFVYQFKGRQPVMTLQERITTVGACRYVDTVIVNDGTDQQQLIYSMEPTILAIGEDWARKDYYGQLGISAEWLRERDILLVYLATTVVSTTELRARVMARAEAKPEVVNA